MKRLIPSVIVTLALLLISLVGSCQTWQADTLVYYRSAFNPSPDTTVVDEITIVVERGTLSISKKNAFFQALIEDTLPVQRMGYGIVDKVFKVRRYISMSKQDTGYVLTMIMSYFDGKLIALGLLHGEQLFIYHIVNELFNGNARQRKYPYFRDWARVALGGDDGVQGDR